MSQTEKQLLAAGYQIVRVVSTRERLGGDWINGYLHGPAKTGKWFEVKLPSGETALLLKQSPACWHVFGESCWTASGSDLATAHRGGLGDAISTDSQMKTYARLVKRAPESLASKYDGLNAAKQQVYA